MARRTAFSIAFASLAALALAGCGGGGEANLASLDNQLTNDADPALTAALQDQIAVDPNLAQQSNRNAVRPPETPTQAPYPVDSARAPQPQGNGKPAMAKPAAQLASAPSGSGANCTSGAAFDYNDAWAQRLPAALPVYPNGRLTEAAANNANGCRTRVVSFTTADNAQRVLGWYQDRATKAGYSADRDTREGDQILAGTDPQGGAFYLIVTPRKNGSEVALIVNNGR
jgi:hypothetical protein